MSSEIKQADFKRAKIFNLPNQLTCMRLVLSVVLFCLMACDCYLAGLVVFIIGAGTDWVDGYFARKYGQITTLAASRSLCRQSNRLRNVYFPGGRSGDGKVPLGTKGLDGGGHCGPGVIGNGAEEFY